MAKIDLVNNKIALYVICEAIGEERKDFLNIKPDENGLYDMKIFLNGVEVNAERFLENLYRSYRESVKKQASDLLSLEYDKMLDSIYEIQEALEHHNKVFEEKVYGNK